MTRRAEKIIMLCTAIVNKRIEVQKATKLNRELASLEKELLYMLEKGTSAESSAVATENKVQLSEDSGQLNIPQVNNEHF